MTDYNKNQDKKITDPFASREAAKYASPIPSREYIISVVQRFDGVITLAQLQQELAITKDKDKIALKFRLKAMMRDRQLKKEGNNYYLRELLNNGNSDAMLQREIPYELKKVIGVLFQVNQFNYVTPFLSKKLDQDVLIPLGCEEGAQAGDLVAAEVMMPAFKWDDPVGKITNIIGKLNKRDDLIRAAIMSLELPHTWSDEVKHELARIDRNIGENLIGSRVDLRDLDFITIDGEDAKDFDDAVYAQALPRNNWRLYVAIADVSYYVTANSAIDCAANLRGNSVYFPGKVIAMLPEILSNNLCSLRPNTPRLALVCEMQLGRKGKLLKYNFYEAVICSKARLTYNEVDAYLCGDNTPKFSSKVEANILALHNLYKLLRLQREDRGAIDFETSENKLIFDKKGTPIEIKVFKRNIAHKIIEECMLSANVATAKFLEQHKLLSIYRVHEGPTSIKLLDLKAFLAGVGLSLNGNSCPVPKDYANLLQAIATRHDAEVIQMILLRSMCQAAYSTENIGHFGLAYPAYTHFTSPIRRYTDLLVHRHIKLILHNQADSKVIAEKLKLTAEHCSMTERRADEATREVIKGFKCQYLIKYIGSTFNAVVCGVTKFGLFVEIKDIYIDGLIHINSLGKDYFVHDPIHHKLIGERTGKVYALGMPLAVVLIKVDLYKRRIDFGLTEDLIAPNSTRKKTKFNKSIHMPTSELPQGKKVKSNKIHKKLPKTNKSKFNHRRDKITKKFKSNKIKLKS